MNHEVLANANDSQYDSAQPATKMQGIYLAVPPEPPALPAPAPAPPPARTRTIESAELFGGTHEVVILHGGREYRLRRTRLGKLILTA